MTQGVLNPQKLLDQVRSALRVKYYTLIATGKKSVRGCDRSLQTGVLRAGGLQTNLSV